PRTGTGDKGKSVTAAGVVFGEPMLDDDHPLTSTVQAIGKLLAAAVDKAPHCGRAGASRHRSGHGAHPLPYNLSSGRGGTFVVVNAHVAKVLAQTSFRIVPLVCSSGRPGDLR